MRRDSELAWLRFLAQVEAQGGRVVEERWLGAHKRHRIICRVGHEVTADPSTVNRGTGICRPCSGTDSAVAEQAFRTLLAERGWSIVEPRWLGAKKPHRVICSEGHEIIPTPSSLVSRGTGCIVCAGKDQGSAWRLFLRLIEEHGGQVLEERPLGVNASHRVRCPQGHETRAIPTSVRKGLGFCHLCRLTSTSRAERQFRELVAELGGRVVEPVWLGTKVPHLLICSAGHEINRRPNDLQQTRSLCRVCIGRDSASSWQDFRDRVAQQGGMVSEPEWLGNKVPHRVICKEGHNGAVRPNNVQQGAGICRTCAYKIWDVFYIVVNDGASTVKFGVTSHDARARLRHHRSDGFHRVVKTITRLDGADLLERHVLSSLKTAHVAPVRGREYYELATLPVILAAVEGWVSGR